MKRLILLVSLLLSATGFAQIDLWHLDEGSGITTADALGSNSGTLQNSPQWVSGISGHALTFNGNSQYVEVSTSPILANLNGSLFDPVQNLTIEAWVKWDGGGAAGLQEVYCEGSYNDLVDFGLNSGVPIFVIDNQPVNWGTVSAISALPVGQWHHLAGVLQAGVGGILYVDGQAVATNANMGPLLAVGYTGESDIGRFGQTSFTPARYFSGTIDEVQLFSTARSSSQVLADYQQFAPTSTPVQYAVDWLKIAGGSGMSTNSIYAIAGTVGQSDVGQQMTNDVYSVTGGFWSLISVVQTPGAPLLSISHSGNTVTVSWPYPSTGWTLQQSSDLLQGSWSTSSNVSDDGTNNFIAITPTENLFFRLSKPE